MNPADYHVHELKRFSERFMKAQSIPKYIKLTLKDIKWTLKDTKWTLKRRNNAKYGFHD